MPDAGPSGRDGPHVFVADLGLPVLDDGDRHHLARALRVRDGDPLTVSDGAGRWRLCRFGAEVEPVGPVEQVPEPAPSITIAFALVKGERPEWIVQKLTELGVDSIRPFTAARSVVRWDPGRAAAATERLRRVAREAAMQSRRCRVPDVEEPVPFATIAALRGAVRAERYGDPLSLQRPVVLVGPEGGWAPEEAAAVGQTANLGAHVLRADTASVAAAVLLCGLRSAVIAPVA